MNTKKIYVVMCHVASRRSSPIRAFPEKPDADEFAAMCNRQVGILCQEKEEDKVTLYSVEEIDMCVADNGDNVEKRSDITKVMTVKIKDMDERIQYLPIPAEVKWWYYVRVNGEEVRDEGFKIVPRDDRETGGMFLLEWDKMITDIILEVGDKVELIPICDEDGRPRVELRISQIVNDWLDF